MKSSGVLLQFKECEREDEIPTLSGNRFVLFYFIESMEVLAEIFSKQSFSPYAELRRPLVGILHYDAWLTPPLYVVLIFFVVVQGVHTSEFLTATNPLPASTTWIARRSIDKGHTSALHTRDQWTCNARGKVYLHLISSYYIMIVMSRIWMRQSEMCP